MAEVLPIRQARRPQRGAAAPPPPPPRGLSAASKRIWASINARWQLDEAASVLLHVALECRDRYAVASRQIQRDGPTIDAPDGRCVVHPAHAIARDNLREFRQLFRQLNLEVSDA